VDLVRSFLLRALAGVAAIGAFGATSLALAPAASASSGGGCGLDTYVQFGEVTACISANGAAVYPDGYVDWNVVPPGSCHVDLQLLDGSGHVVATRTWPCDRTHYGPFPWAGPSDTKWHSVLTVYTSWGAATASSNVEHLVY
jgi:hypothetical protein